MLVTNYWLFCWESFVWMQRHCIREPQRYFYSPYIWISWWRNWSLERLSVSCLRVNRWVITKSLKTQIDSDLFMVANKKHDSSRSPRLPNWDGEVEGDYKPFLLEHLKRMAVSLIEIRNTGRKQCLRCQQCTGRTEKIILRCVRCSCGNRGKDTHFNKSHILTLVGRIKLALVTSFYLIPNSN